MCPIWNLTCRKTVRDFFLSYIEEIQWQKLEWWCVTWPVATCDKFIANQHTVVLRGLISWKHRNETDCEELVMNVISLYKILIYPCRFGIRPFKGTVHSEVKCGLVERVLHTDSNEPPFACMRELELSPKDDTERHVIHITCQLMTCVLLSSRVANVSDVELAADVSYFVLSREIFIRCFPY